MKICNRDCFNCILPDCENDIELSYKAEKQREYNARHPDRVKAANERYRQNNVDKVKAIQREYYEKHKNDEDRKERNRISQKRWYDKQKLLKNSK